MRERRIGVLLVGSSDRSGGSLESGRAVLAALQARGHDARPVFVDRDLDLKLRRCSIDLAFIALRGGTGEDGSVQGLLETVGIPYTGSDVLASALALNRLRAKQIFRLTNLPTPPAYAVPSGFDADRLLARHGDFGFPAVVKPICAGSGIRAAVVADPDELVAACRSAAGRVRALLVERHVDGQRISVAMLDDAALGAMEIDADGRAALSPQLSRERRLGVLRQAEMAHRALGCSGATQVDFIVSPTGNESVLEVDTAPDLGPDGVVRAIAAGVGLSFEELIDEILAGARPAAATDAPARLSA